MLNVRKCLGLILRLSPLVPTREIGTSAGKANTLHSPAPATGVVHPHTHFQFGKVSVSSIICCSFGESMNTWSPSQRTEHKKFKAVFSIRSLSFSSTWFSLLSFHQTVIGMHLQDCISTLQHMTFKKKKTAGCGGTCH